MANGVCYLDKPCENNDVTAIQSQPTPVRARTRAGGDPRHPSIPLKEIEEEPNEEDEDVSGEEENSDIDAVVSQIIQEEEDKSTIEPLTQKSILDLQNFSMIF